MDQAASEQADELPLYPAPRTCPYEPPPAHRAFRDAGGLHRVTLWDGSHPWILTRYDHVRFVLGDARFSADVRHPSFPLVSADKREKEAGVFIRLDDPEHAWQRRMLVGEFTVRNTTARAEAVLEITDQTIDEMLAAPRPADFVKAVALPLPTRTICTMLGVPYEDRETFQRFTTVSLDLNATQEEKLASQREARAYYADLLARKRREPGPDLVSKLLAENGGADGLTDEKATGMVALLVSAGHETTANQLALGTLALLQHPDQLQRMQTDPALADGAVDELLRYWSILANSPRRVALEDVEIDGQVIRAGDGVVMSLSAANRDPEALGTDSDPDELDIARPKVRKHLAFGFGVHQCLGQNLARLELRTAWLRLFERIPDLRLAVPAEEIEFKQNTHVFGLRSLPLTWGDADPTTDPGTPLTA
jgi:cytochrome P450